MADKDRPTAKPVSSPAYDLDDLLAHMPPETFPDNDGFGPPVGKEIDGEE